MRIAGHHLTAREIILLLLLALVLTGLACYQFVERPVRQGLEEARIRRNALQAELTALDARIEGYREREDGRNQGGDALQDMPVYNSGEEELRIVNQIMSASGRFVVSFHNVTVEGVQVRRDFDLSFTAADFETARDIFARLADSPIRCLIGDIRCSGSDAEDNGAVSVRANGTFYETLVGGEWDAGLPEEAGAYFKTAQ